MKWPIPTFQRGTNQEHLVINIFSKHFKLGKHFMNRLRLIYEIREIFPI